MTTLRRVLSVALLLVVVPALPASAGGGGCHGASPSEATGVDVAMSKFCMTPTVLHVSPGATVTWTNDDPVVHNLYGTGWARGDLNPGQSATWTFDSPGTYPYACTLHPGMTGAVVVDAGAAGTDSPDATALSAAPVGPVAPVAPAAAVRSDDGGGSSPVGPVVIGLLAVIALGGAFAAGARRGRRPAS